jgi:hypothetical protein
MSICRWEKFFRQTLAIKGSIRKRESREGQGRGGKGREGRGRGGNSVANLAFAGTFSLSSSISSFGPSGNTEFHASRHFRVQGVLRGRSTNISVYKSSRDEKMFVFVYPLLELSCQVALCVAI